MKSAHRRAARYGAFAVVGLYAAAAIALAAFSRAMVFPVPPPRALAPLPAGVVQIDDCGTDGVRCLYTAAAPGQPTVVAFHGNGQQLADLRWMFPPFEARGLGLLAVEYPGYGGTPGAPTEESLYIAASGAIAHLRQVLHVPAAQTVLWGRSLGTGVATELARDGAGSRLVLISPFTSIPAVGQRMFPFLPVRWLVRDRFDSLAKAPEVKVPALVVHGTRDDVVPFELGKTLAAHLPQATFLPVPGADHHDLLQHPEVMEAILQFAARGAVPPNASPAPPNAQR